MIVAVLAFLGGALTILSPCILDPGVQAYSFTFG
jgi:cytochrome c biogenesis protein CcdA